MIDDYDMMEWQDILPYKESVTLRQEVSIMDDEYDEDVYTDYSYDEYDDEYDNEPWPTSIERKSWLYYGGTV